jgi:uncharacterized protein (DUF2252 family)
MTVRTNLDDRRAAGYVARSRTPRSAHAGWTPATDRPSPVTLLREQNAEREPDLIPVRHGRMVVSPFTFYRGAARVMAEDLKDTPRAGLDVQLCGDAHLLNFGVFGSPERRLVFDLNDFDETLPGPFEYDVKRMAASFLIAARDNGFTKAEAHEAALASVTAYRTAMRDFAQRRTMDVWYASMDEDAITQSVTDFVTTHADAAKKAKAGHKKTARRTAKHAKRAARQLQKGRVKAHARDSLQALSKLGEMAGDRYRIVSQPPIVIPVRDVAAQLSPGQLDQLIREQFRSYRASLPPDMRLLLERFEVVDIARKVVGVGSVGTRCFIVLLAGRDMQDPLFLQVKEATASVFEEHLPRSRYRQHGQRVVQGQRLMQAASDIYLGWTKGVDRSRHFYWRQLRDMKGAAVVEEMTSLGLTLYARACGWTLARAHARSGDPVAITAYLGEGDAFDRSIWDFAVRYAEQNERDYAEFAAAIRSGQLPATDGILGRGGNLLPPPAKVSSGPLSQPGRPSSSRCSQVRPIHSRAASVIVGSLR